MTPLGQSNGRTRRSAVRLLCGRGLLLLLPLLLLGCRSDTAGPPPSTLITISLSPGTLDPVVDRDPAPGYRGAAVLWRSSHGADTAWVVRFIGGSPFRDGVAEFESGSNPKTLVGAEILPNADLGDVFPYVVKIVVNDGADTLGSDPEIIIRDPPT